MINNDNYKNVSDFVLYLSNQVALYYHFIDNFHKERSNVENALKAVIIFLYDDLIHNNSVFEDVLNIFSENAQYEYLSLGKIPNSPNYIRVELDKETIQMSTILHKYLLVIIMQLSCLLLHNDKEKVISKSENIEITNEVIKLIPNIKANLITGLWGKNENPFLLPTSEIISKIKQFDTDEFNQKIEYFAVVCRANWAVVNIEYFDILSTIKI